MRGDSARWQHALSDEQFLMRGGILRMPVADVQFPKHAGWLLKSGVSHLRLFSDAQFQVHGMVSWIFM